ncbi:MAG: hypothetical protein ACLRMJ_08680 [Alistipes finegoldii]
MDDLIWTKIWVESQQITLSSMLSRVRTTTSGPTSGRDGLYRLAYGVSRTGRSRRVRPRPLRDEGDD